ncbi:DUF488 family protein [Methanosphaera sp.]|uniref:DUF488 family protein, N3 subclade n=1 Tax=Methanosphaera sp. TaxID=2666342 RepID=UPI0025DDC60B|nr:DUF488 family protein [Methanosphaera sp.]
MNDNRSSIVRRSTNIYTSYFANWHNFPEGSIIVSITRFAPKGWNGLELRSCAPSEGLLRDYKNGNIDEYIFEQRYIMQLNKDSNLRERIKAVLNELVKKNDVILCCYEKKGDFCHRNILSKWLSPDIEINEL